MPDESSTPDGRVVHIVGGGIAGLTMAILLHRSGVPCTVHEAGSHRSGIGGGLNVATNGMKVLAAAGVADRVTAAGTTVDTYALLGQDGTVLVEFPYSEPEVHGQPCVSLARATLLGILTDRARRLGVDIRYGAKVVEVSAPGDTLRFADGTTASGRLVVGADGAHSSVRRFVAHQGSTAEYAGLVGIAGATRVAALPGLDRAEIEAITLTIGAGGLLGWGGGDAGTIMWWTYLPHDTDPGWPVTREKLLDRFAGYPKPVGAVIANTDSASRVRLYGVAPLPSWHRDRAVLIGDAAHAVPPTSGQGASLALEDAAHLAGLLAAEDDHRAAFARFEQHRRPRVERAVTEASLGPADGDSAVAALIVGGLPGGPDLIRRANDVLTESFVGLYSDEGRRWKFGYDVP
ncbi:FAD-dependent oxidoreductase [Solihabitans fulvus]|uniref:FAD-dependent oxidoreductase n=1 Tax=Solihabitans fulvus TaxID=1892852 RepID=UPI001661A546|nr:FAD-dependent monooxygenase [Solihabitans fulvus]